LQAQYLLNTVAFAMQARLRTEFEAKPMTAAYQPSIFTTESAPSPQDTALLDALGVPAHLRSFEPNHASAHARAGRTSPSHYARTRNALDGGVTGLSPYLTHGITSLSEVARTVGAKHKLGYNDKLVFELGWRAFFQHVWASATHADAILADMRPAQVWRGRYASALPADITQGRTGVKAIDAAVRQLYATGYLHNHARMWLASYCVHLRKVHWRAGADWLYAHLLDGDLPSNHLSWQWVAATFSSKPYLFNASNVAKFAPEVAWKAWGSSKSCIDLSYEQLDTVARLQDDVGAEPGVHAGVAQPAVYTAQGLLQLDEFAAFGDVVAVRNAVHKAMQKTAPAGLPELALELVHPWAMGERSVASAAMLLGGDGPEPLLRIGIVHAPAHAQWPWSLRRWQFVLARMQAVCDVVFMGDVVQLALCAAWPGAPRVVAQSTLFEGYATMLPRLATVRPAPALFAEPDVACTSFSKFYERVQRAQPDFSKLISIHTQLSP
jgi:deoxyribodipyrimidine photo-lyase